METNDLWVELILEDADSGECCCCNPFVAGDGLNDGAIRHAFVGVSGASDALLISPSEEEEFTILL